MLLLKISLSTVSFFVQVYPSCFIFSFLQLSIDRSMSKIKIDISFILVIVVATNKYFVGSTRGAATIYVSTLFVFNVYSNNI